MWSVMKPGLCCTAPSYLHLLQSVLERIILLPDSSISKIKLHTEANFVTSTTIYQQWAIGGLI